MKLVPHTSLQQASGMAGQVSPSDGGLLAAFLLRARLNRAFYLSLGIFGALAILGLVTGRLPSDVVVTIGIFFILAMGLDLLFGMVGMLSFAHVGFFSTAAYVVAVLNALYGVNIWAAGLVAVAVNCVLSYILGRICLRLSSHYFIFGTLAFGLMAHAIIIVAYPITGGGAGLGGIERIGLGPIALTTDRSFGMFVWAIAAIFLWYTLALKNSRLGRAMKSARSDAEAAQALGINVTRLRTNAFVLSALYASVAGTLFATYFGAVHPDSFGLGAIVTVLLMVFIGGYGSIWGSLIGATFMTVLPDLNHTLREARDLLNGILFGVIILAFPRGIAGGIERGIEVMRRSAGLAPPASILDAAWGDTVTSRSVKDASSGPYGARVEVTAVSKHFGGVKALDGVSFHIEPGSICGLIGPNGAGKSTMVNTISGALQRTAGSVTVDGEEFDAIPPHQVSQRGVVRTFQHERLFEDLDVLENIMVGYEKGAEGNLRDIFVSLFGLRSWLGEEHRARAHAHAWLRALDIDQYAHHRVDTLPSGIRKMIEVLRACASRPCVLLLDEVAAGLNPTERGKLRNFVLRLKESGMTILLIEHDLEFVRSLADEICVLDFGRRIAFGKPAEIFADEQVISAYLGT